VALTHEGASDLSLQWRERTVDKAYEAVVAGVVEADEGLIEWALLRIDVEHRSGDPSRVECVDDDVPGAKLSRSSYKVLERNDKATRLDLIPHTGRLHQLRAHCKSLGHPIVGDWLYGEGDANRLCLHASRLAFNDASLGERVRVASVARWTLEEPHELLYARDVT
jgi:tRNA pseudouridine32 synthase/23S rRNA pseudouridine746 synthase